MIYKYNNYYLYKAFTKESTFQIYYFSSSTQPGHETEITRHFFIEDTETWTI